MRELTKRQKILAVPLVLIVVLSIVNFFFILGILDGEAVLSRLQTVLGSEGPIERPLQHLLVLQGEGILAFLAVAIAFRRRKTAKISSLLAGSYCIVAFLLVLFLIFRESAYWETGLYSEDSLLEYMTVVLYLAAAFILLRLLFRQGRKDRSRTAILIMLSAGFLFLAMEEISWGQRILGLHTPESLESVNRKSEINLHNLLAPPFDDVIYVTFYVAASLFLLGSLWEGKISRSGRLASFSPFLPGPGFTAFGLLFPAMLMVHHYVFIWEVYEQILSVIGLAYALELRNRLPLGREGSPEVPDRS